jgi:hypothetical protein
MFLDDGYVDSVFVLAHATIVAGRRDRATPPMGQLRGYNEKSDLIEKPLNSRHTGKFGRYAVN